MDEEERKQLKLSSSSSSKDYGNSSSSSDRSPSAARGGGGSTSRRTSISWMSTTVFISFIVLLIVCGVFFSGYDVVVFNRPLFSSTTAAQTNSPSSNTTKKSSPARTIIEYPLNCSSEAASQKKCPGYPTIREPDHDYSATCPEYFRWIHEDLRPWKDTGITREVLESNNKKWAHFRFIVYKGKPYLETFHRAWQTRDVYTIWGFLQLMRLYPGRVPDLELIFCCEDPPAVLKKDFSRPNSPKPPPLFHYCGTDSTFDIPFPDWSFWGWPEVNIKPWENTLKDIEDKEKRIKWKDREPYAYWKGNPYVSRERGELMKCRPNKDHDWYARLYEVHWDKESSSGFKDSKLEDQCKHRYKIYVEGRAWSVSEKYILACDAMTLLIKPTYYDFFVRGMIPLKHYWPIRPNNKCRDIKFAVDWGNNHPWEAQALGEGGAEFAMENLSMPKIYDYMFHLLKEYAKLQKYKVKVPPGAVEICAESWACPTDGIVRQFMEDTLVKSPSSTLPCTMPPPYEPHELKAFIDRKNNITRQVESWEADYWRNYDKLH